MLMVVTELNYRYLLTSCHFIGKVLVNSIPEGVIKGTFKNNSKLNEAITDTKDVIEERVKN